MRKQNVEKKKSNLKKPHVSIYFFKIHFKNTYISKEYNISFIQGKGEQERIFKHLSSAVCLLHVVILLLSDRNTKVSLVSLEVVFN